MYTFEQADKVCHCRFLNEVQTYSSSNKMNIENLATVFGPNILRPKAEDPESIIGGRFDVWVWEKGGKNISKKRE